MDVLAMTTDNMVNDVSRIPHSHVGCSALMLQLAVNIALTASNVDQAIDKQRKIADMWDISAVSFKFCHWAQSALLRKRNGLQVYSVVLKLYSS